MTDAAQGHQAHLSRTELNVLPSLYCSNNPVVFSACLLSTLFIWTKQIPTAPQFPNSHSLCKDKCCIVVFANRFFCSLLFYFVLRKGFPGRCRNLAWKTLAFWGSVLSLCSDILDKLYDTTSELRGFFPIPPLHSYWSLTLYTSLTLF